MLTAAAAAYASTPGRASNFPVSPELAAQYSCGESCQVVLNKTSAKDVARFDIPFDFDFYETAANFSSSKLGDLLKIAPLNPKIMNIPAGIVVYRIQYTSADLDYTTVPATAYIAFPYARQRRPFRLIAYAHGTTGVFRGCAPSTSSTLTDYNSWSPLLLAGYAVVGTDYAGLGNNYTSHKYISSRANANDVYWSTVAAKNAFPHELSNEWVSIGHSQGGGASWKLSEHEVVQSEGSGYLGGVSIAPVTYLYDALIDGFTKLQGFSSQKLESFGIVSIVPSMYFALRAVFDNYTAPFLPKTMMDRINLGEKAQLCDSALSGLTADLNTSELIENINLDSIAPIKRFQELNAPAQGVKTSKPMLVIQGANDSVVFPDITDKAYNNSCKTGNAVHLSVYPELDHSAVVGASAPEWLEFINELFSGKGLSGCATQTIAPFDAEHARKPGDTE
ncbi:hypothetical protein NEMBOFW57_001270 [Staphylotrichum longicolle]|uniref:Uncharacterized protein n=1 Tax=Staphylotrichum longicolle TaxID=669026 RepID=A0AAD4I3L5_9PEZI|nr:hypothetical protein NEMBOFW57_001270 [Staphylotrichum longicolle]